MRAVVETAGQTLGVDCALPWLAAVLTEGLAGEGRTPRPGERVDVQVTVEASSAPFATNGWAVLSRDAAAQDGVVVVEDACSSGFDLAVTTSEDRLDVRARWRPTTRTRVASTLLPTRARLLVREVLVQYPVLWWAARRGSAPLHASVCAPAPLDGEVVLLAGPGGIGKSTVVQAVLAAGGVATSDNLCVSDGQRAWGVAEPLRVAGSMPGRRVTHGRVETAWPDRAACLEPTMVVVLARGGPAESGHRPIDPVAACRSLVAGTYMAGELRRFWGLAATLALGTGQGPAHPALEEVARRLTDRLPCRQLSLPSPPGPGLAALLGAAQTVAQP